MSKSILLVDDEDMILDSLSATLTREGYQVDCVRSGAEALDVLKGRAYDLVITDIRMPGMDGFEVVERVKTTAPQQKIMVITGFGSLETAVKAQHRGACDYLLKPFNFQELKESVRRAISSGPGEEAPAERTLEHKLKEMSDSFMLLSDFTANLSASLDVQEIMQRTLECFKTIGETATASIALLPEAIERLYYIKNQREMPPLAAGRGISSFVVETGQQFTEPVMVSADREPGPKPADTLETLARTSMAHEGVRHALLLPIRVQQAFLGAADVCTNAPFTNTDRAILRTIVSQLAIALGRAFSYLEVEERSRQIGYLYNLSMKLNESLKITDSIKAICEGAVDIAGAGGSLLQTSLELGSLRNNLYQRDIGFHKEVKRTSHDWLITQSARKEPFVANDPLVDPRVNSLAVSSLGIRSLAYVPLTYDWEDLGGLTVFHKNDDRQFDERDLHLLHLFARHASEVLLNAQLFEAIRKSREKIIHEKNKMDIVLDTIGDGVVTIDPYCRVTYVNSALLRILGRSAEDAVGVFCHELFSQECSADACPVKRPVGEDPARHCFTENIKTGQNGSMPVQVSLAPVRGSNGAVSAWIKVIRTDREVTERGTGTAATSMCGGDAIP